MSNKQGIKEILQLFGLRGKGKNREERSVDLVKKKTERSVDYFGSTKIP